MSKDKKRQIERLNESLNHPKKLAGAFLPKGHKERFDIMFLGEMPSMNKPKEIKNNENFNFNVTKRDKFFQKMMTKYSVAGNYVTDIVKRRDVPRWPTKKEIKKWLPFLLKEIKIINPKTIIIIGKRTYKQSFRPFVEPLVPKNIKIDYIFHYCSQVPRSKFEKRLKEVVKITKKINL